MNPYISTARKNQRFPFWPILAFALIFLLPPLELSAQAGEASARFSQKSVRSFVSECLRQVARRDEKLLSRLIDSNIIFPVDRIKEILKYQDDPRWWRKAFPGYSNLSEGRIRRVLYRDIHGPIKTTVRFLKGVDKKGRPIWDNKKGQYMLVYVRLPGTIEERACKVFLIEGKLYWEPFDW